MTIAEPPVAEDEPKGLGGWLLVIMAILAIAPINGVFALAEYGQVFQSFPNLTYPQIFLMLLEVVFLVVLDLVAPVVLLYLMVKKLDIFPGAFMLWLLAAIASLCVDAALGYLFFSDFIEANGTPFFSSDFKRRFMRSVAYAVVCIPYMYNSNRVLNTFVNK
ncbi:DUF2569 family protein [Aminobacter sp. HY435]|uniref:DUF2569 family protein n=1 Tax=Aminobacter sp. HY435 TaxID=2970917 RepID=UPI0022B957C9|nr:DUF2569 family protein [Aminobacter sp. HY435]